MIRLISPELLGAAEENWVLVGPDTPPPVAEQRPSFHAILCSRKAPPSVAAAEQDPASPEDDASPEDEVPASADAASVEPAVVETLDQETAAVVVELGAVDEAPYTGEPRWWGRHIGAEKKSRGHRSKVTRASERRATQRAAAVC